MIPCTLDNFQLDTETIEDGFAKSIPVQEVPFADGAITQDMGSRARRIKLRCFFFNDAYESHAEFANSITDGRGRGLHVLIHPVYGLLNGRIDSITVRHDDRKRTAEVDVSFVEDRRSNVSVSAREDISGACNKAYSAGMVQQVLAATQDVIDAIGAEARSIIETVLNPAQSIAGQIAGISMAARDVVRSIDAGIMQAQGIAATVEIASSSAVSLLVWPATIPGRIVQALAQGFQRTAESLAGVCASPGQFIDAMSASVDGAIETFASVGFPFSKHALISGSMTLALYSSYRYAEDESRRDAVRAFESGQSFSLGGEYLDPPQPPAIMTVNEIESTLAAIRTRLQAAIGTAGQDVARDVPALNDLANVLLHHANQIKIQRDRVYTRQYSTKMPLFTACLREGVSYRTADRILSLNPTVSNPSAFGGFVSIYAKKAA